MLIKISGITGYIGSVISKELRDRGHSVEGISRELLYGPTDQLANYLNGTDAVIHLAGSAILTRWTDKNKKIILESRSETARNLTHALKSLPSGIRPEKVISASGISIYNPGKSHTENSIDFGKGFLVEVVKQWETAWIDLPKDVGLTIFRMAVVLGKKSPAIQNMLLPFKLGLGGKIGNGYQPFPFVHEEDVAKAYVWALETPVSGGLYILAAPYPVSNSTFTGALAKTLNRPAFMTVPSLALKLIYGEASTMLTESPEVHPEKLLNKGFRFKYPTIEETLEAIFK